ncbi:type II/IV secretion system protein [Carboxylicivirga sediminis]|uniref:Type II/IV secretion system protein n=1 Tax=Carboxylicivirga sediminis TaxID=2006564 RepID=A0A941F2W7_9BACT|nr:GspE/PulE family protein [Carboxylicivirga sediminis]MBR8534949.1 type II/IV secretion system protein [Carboxylicivirga sediminis]
MEFTLSTELKQLITTDQAWHYHILPKESVSDSITFYFSEEHFEKDELDNELLVLLGKDILLEAKPDGWIIEHLSRYYPRDEREQAGEGAKELSMRAGADLLSQMIEEAARIKSSDIHLEAYEERCRVRFRIDGKLVERYVIGVNDYPALTNKIKIKANLDIAEKRLPQDGRIIFNENGRKFDIRVSVLPTLHGEKTVLRLLNRDATQIDLDILGFQKEQLDDYLEGVRKPNGIVLISGPTGSGKTTTLYATLKMLNKEHTNILTIEDPIEYTLEGINQVQLKEAIGLDFASAMRTFLRQDPDIIMVGEIRDTETARMAVRAALTGHLVLSTVHTNSAWGTVTRLVDMGVPAYLVASTFNLSVAQRLVRCLCECKKQVDFDEADYPAGFTAPVKINKHYVPGGCSKCFYTGYRGRRALYEIIPIDSQLKESIRHEAFDVSEYLKEKHIMNLSEVAFDMFNDGQTSLEEVYPILSMH